MCLLHLFCLSFQNKLVAVYVHKGRQKWVLKPSVYFLISLQHSWFLGCEQQCASNTWCTAMILQGFPPAHVFINVQVCERLLVGHEFYHERKQKITLLHEEGIKDQSHWIQPRSFPEVTRTWGGGVTTPDFASCSPSLWPLRVLGTLCSNSCLPAFQDMTQATGEAAQIMLQMLLFYRVSFPVCHLS